MAVGSEITIENTSGVALGGVPHGGKVRVKCDVNGLPFDRFWRNRLRDAETDYCVKVVPVAKIETKAKAAIVAPAEIEEGSK